MESLLFGLINILIYVAVAAIIVYLIIAVSGWIGFALPPIVVKLLWVVVALIALLMLLQLLLGVGVGPPYRFRPLS